MVANEFLSISQLWQLFSYSFAYLSIYHGLMDIYLFSVLQSVVLIILFKALIGPEFASYNPS